MASSPPRGSSVVAASAAVPAAALAPLLLLLLLLAGSSSALNVGGGVGGVVAGGGPATAAAAGRARGYATTTAVSRLMTTRRLPITMPTQTPMVPYKPPGQDYAQFIDIYQRMMQDRTMFIGNFIDEDSANNIISTLLYLRKEDPDAAISLYFNVPGALLRPGLAVYDLLCQLRRDCEISTVNLGLCTGMGALLCGAGTRGKRCAMPNARFLLQRIGLESPFRGQASDIGLEVSNVKVWNDRLEGELARMTGQAREVVSGDMRRDFYLSSEEAVRYGLIDKVLLPAPQKRATQGKEVDLGTFEGEDEQRFQNRKKSGWGSGWKEADARSRDKKDDDDDDEPKILKG